MAFMKRKLFSMTKRAWADKVFNTFAFEQKTKASTSVILFPVKPRDSKYITRRKIGYSFNFLIINDN